MRASMEPRLRVLLPVEQVFEAEGEGVVALGGIVAEGASPGSVRDRDGTRTVDLRAAGLGTLLAAAAATRDLRVQAREAGAQLAGAIAALPRCVPREGESIDDADFEDIAVALGRGPGISAALRETWLGQPDVARALVKRLLAAPRPGDLVAIPRLLPVAERAAAWLALMSYPTEEVRASVFDVLAPRYSFPGAHPLELTPEDATRLLSHGLRDGSGRVRAQAVRWARLIGFVGRIAAAVKEGVRDANPDFRQQCLRALGEVGDGESLALARGALAREDEEDAIAAVEALAALDDAEGIVRACLDPRRFVQIAAARALSNSKSITADHLRRLSPPSEEVKFAYDVCKLRLRSV